MSPFTCPPLNAMANSLPFATQQCVHPPALQLRTASTSMTWATATSADIPIDAVSRLGVRDGASRHTLRHCPITNRTPELSP